jgi:TPR repeat protein
MYENAEGTKKDYRKAARLYADAADNGDAKGRAFLGEMYYYGKGVNTDKKQGIELYKQAAAMGSNYAKERLEALGIKNDKLGDEAYVAYLKKDYKGAIKVWKKRALAGDIAAMVNLGHVYKGAKTVQDYKQAKAWYELAIGQANSEAMVALGDMYNYGLGVPLDYEKAYQLYSNAIMEDDPNGVYMFATMYDRGHSVEQDKEKALKLYQVAADMGSSEAKSMLDFYRKKAIRKARWDQMVANLDAIEARVARQKRECSDLAYRGNLEASRRSGQYHTYSYKPPTRCLGSNVSR